MTSPLAPAALETLPRTAASDVKKHGWRGVMQTVSHHGKVLVTNHNAPEAVILSTSEYRAMVAAIQAAQAHVPATLDALRKRFDERLASLNTDDAGDRLRSLMNQPLQLEGKLKAGSSY
ncbi:MAG: type II toxin-antitoxin system prevent-host-death family antitoxin [Oxalicibacterium faecigallinarum]|uniref:type II toxin-antitoxin system prevent-host-death family antitoxin n=1 Tax=Oxalicibacterium faecigallinarum TaxID=573741 RepID=UPI0028084C51|nr:type II toxin-antitoxin system prevent-host-death family antitoxin [Oxalicibacterium faecigallinarum]MDQ7970172.1 type II toxin-antitoxin system prevent-host-death family antitoxin [Oxalicibacterium faecigallinarum]